MHIDLLFCGDFAPCRRFEQFAIKHGDSLLGEFAGVVQSADVSFVNLECPLTRRNVAINKSGPCLKADPACVEVIKGFSVVGLANNHILDFGREGLVDTVQTCEQAELPTVGAGLNISQAREPYLVESKGKSIAIIAIAEHEFNQAKTGCAGSAPLNLVDNFRQIKDAQEKAEIVVVTIHGGNEYFPFPRPGLRKVCQHFVELGVDAVVCHHAHVPGAYEIYEGKPIVYSLGNFVFDSHNPPKDWNRGYAARIRVGVDETSSSSIELLPYVQSIADRGVKLLQDAEKSAFLEEIEACRAVLASDHEWKQKWAQFVEKKSNLYILRQFFPFTMRGLGFLARNTPLARLFYNRPNSLDKLNLLRCQSHRELLIAILESRSKPRND